MSLGSRIASIMIVRYASFLFFPALVHGVPGVMPFLGLEPTPLGLMASAGISPRPTEAPNWDGIPKELLRRQNVQFPPPENWCGFVNGIYRTDHFILSLPPKPGRKFTD